MEQIVMERISKSFTIYSRRTQGKRRISALWQREKKTVEALKDISFTIQKGELVGYIGPNGAGKSTTIKVMSGILTPTKGNCMINGRIPWKNRSAHVAGIGVVFGQRSQLWWDVPVTDSYNLMKKIYRLKDEVYKKRLSELTAALDIEALLTIPVRQLSLGQRMRCEVAAALLHSPDILFLDEPTIGLDAVSKLALRQFLKEENRKREITMLLTTHDMDDIAALCSRVMVIGKGELLYDGNMEHLKKKYAPLHCLRLKLDTEVRREEVHLALSGIEHIFWEGDVCVIWFHPGKAAVSGLIKAVESRFAVKDIIVQEQNIDEIIAAMYEKLQMTEKRGEEA